jgi:hypothetical protein
LPKDDEGELDEEKEAAMTAALEFMTTLCEAKLGIFLSVHKWTAAVMRGYLKSLVITCDVNKQRSQPADDNSDARTSEQFIHSP